MKICIIGHKFYRKLKIANTTKNSLCFFHKVCKMEEDGLKQRTLVPPASVRGIKSLDRNAFDKEFDIPYIMVPTNALKEAMKLLKPCLLKLSKLPNVTDEGDKKKILLNPDLFDEKVLYLKRILNDLHLESASFTKVVVRYENWSCDSIFRAVLPLNTPRNVSSFSVIGHIIHVNLKPDLMDYRHVIGQVFLDKYPNIRTVVNKAQIIETEFRNFEMELLAGEPDYEALVKENGIQYAFDFSKVFWNPRLIREHEEIVKKLNTGDLVYDIFAGVGPFAIPAAKKKCKVHANDLNPDSVKWLDHNAKINKVNDNIYSYCQDGHDFIRNVVRDGIINLWNSDGGTNCQIHIIMNLPACALEFLKNFKGLLNGHDLNNIGKLPVVYCYFFKKKDDNVSDILQNFLDEDSQASAEVSAVRLVAPNKEMMRAEYVIPKSVLFYDEENLEPFPKKLKQDNILSS